MHALGSRTIRIQRVFAPLMLAVFLAVPVAASAMPKVMLHLTGSLLTRGADGAVVTPPVEKVVLKSGDHVEYVIVATNTGTSSAVRLVPQGRIPAGTMFVRGTALAPHAHPEYTVDGKSWAAAPTVVVKSATFFFNVNAYT